MASNAGTRWSSRRCRKRDLDGAPIVASAHRHDVAISQAHHVVRYTAQKNSFDGAKPAAAHDDHISLATLGDIDDRARNRAGLGDRLHLLQALAAGTLFRFIQDVLCYISDEQIRSAFELLNLHVALQ